MNHSPILAPVVALLAWTALVTIWMMIARGIAFRRAGIVIKDLPAGTRGPDLEPRIEPRLQWSVHNYNHLFEQPTAFYAVCICLALMGFGTGINVWLAWAYVALRVLHSLVQMTVNVVLYRATLWALSALCLIGLTTHAAIFLIHHG